MLFILEGWVRDYPGNPAFFVPKSLKDKVAAVSEQLQSQHRALACSALALSHTTQRTPVIITPFRYSTAVA
jgi:sugar-specific transcriptional regulator TrmB